jgi:hypothetical protein
MIRGRVIPVQQLSKAVHKSASSRLAQAVSLTAIMLGSRAGGAFFGAGFLRTKTTHAVFPWLVLSYARIASFALVNHDNLYGITKLHFLISQPMI